MMLAISVDFIWKGDTYVALCTTDGFDVNVESLVRDDGQVPDQLDWDMIEIVEKMAIAFWMDEQATCDNFSSLDH
jgi:hypothetical protein